MHDGPVDRRETPDARTILVVSPYYHPFPRVGAIKRIASFVRYLPESGISPVVLTMDWGSIDRSSPERVYRTRNFAAFSWRAYQSADLQSGNSIGHLFRKAMVGIVRRVRTCLLVPDELVLWGLPAVFASRRLVSREHPCLILVTAPPYSSLLTAVVLKKLYRLPLICDLRDDWGGNPLVEKESGFLRWLENRMERWVVNHADAVLVMTDESRDHWILRHPGSTQRIVLLPNGYCEEEFEAATARHFGHFALVHVGSLEAGRSPDLILKAMARLRQAGLAVHFHQFGIALNEFRDQVLSIGLEDQVHFEGMVTAREAISCMLGASVLVLLPTRTAPTAIPGKAYEYLRAGRPILMVSGENATTRLMMQFPGVYRIDPDDEEQCMQVIAGLAGSKDKALPGVPSGIQAYERRMLTRELAKLILELTRQRP